MGNTDLDRVRRRNRLRSIRFGYALRVVLAVIMIGAALVGVDPNSNVALGVLVTIYAVAAVTAVIIVHSPASRLVIGDPMVLALSAVDVVAVLLFEMLTAGGFIPLLLIALLPMVVATGLSWRPVAAVLTSLVVVFGIELWRDPAFEQRLGWKSAALLLAMYVFLCGVRLAVALFRARYEAEVEALTESREALLAQTMTSSEAQRRQIAESIHDGPLQDVLAARRDIADHIKTSPAEPLERAVSSLHDASRRLREATFELHPAVLDQVGLHAAIERLAAVTAERAAMTIDTDIDYPNTNAIDPLVFGVVRELLANIVRHSQADHASLTLAVTAGRCRLDVVDNGIGISAESPALRLAQGHIGLASQRARVQSAGGSMTIVDEPVGTHLRVEVPLR
jgi:two-component system, NarL family, sensor kinase